jgi:hypothetical protein
MSKFTSSSREWLTTIPRHSNRAKIYAMRKPHGQTNVTSPSLMRKIALNKPKKAK